MEVNKNLSTSIKKASMLTMLAFSTLLPVYGQGAYALKQVNSPYDEQHPILSPKEELFVTVGYHPQNKAGEKDKGDIWFSTKNDFNQWEKPQRIDQLSTAGYDVLLGFISEKSVLVYHDGKGKSHGIHQYSREENDWKHEGVLDFGSFRNKGDAFGGRLHISGEILLFSMDSYGSYGNEDIYVSFRKGNGRWSMPKNLGPKVNSFQQEMTPFLSKDKKVLYFSSNGHGSLGGRDVFYAQRLDDSWENWTTPQRLTDATNTEGVELSYFVDPGNAYTSFFTTTQNSEGYGDIMMQRAEEVVLVEQEEKNWVPSPPSSASLYSTAAIQENKDDEATIIETSNTSLVVEADNTEKKEISIRVLDINTKEPLEYRIIYKDAAGNELNKIDVSKDREVLPKMENVTHLTFRSTGYLPLSTTLEQVENQMAPILLKPAKKGTRLVLEDILFKRGTSELADSQSESSIQQLVEFLQENPTLRIRLDGHTDNIGNSRLNKELSMDRAGTIRDYMIDQGVDFERIRVNGWGGSKPIADNQTEEGRILNRRVEMVIIE